MEIGETYTVRLNGYLRRFMVLSLREFEALIRWDDNEEEWAYFKDIETWMEQVWK
jgi:hypothetical protein